MPETVSREIMPARSAFGGHSPAQRARPTRKLLRRGELRDRRAAQDALVRIYASVQKHLTEVREIGRRAKQPGVPRDAADGKRVLVMNFPLHQPLAKIGVKFRRCN